MLNPELIGVDFRSARGGWLRAEWGGANSQEERRLGLELPRWGEDLPDWIFDNNDGRANWYRGMNVLAKSDKVLVMNVDMGLGDMAQCLRPQEIVSNHFGCLGKEVKAVTAKGLIDLIKGNWKGELVDKVSINEITDPGTVIVDLSVHAKMWTAEGVTKWLGEEGIENVDYVLSDLRRAGRLIDVAIFNGWNRKAWQKRMNSEYGYTGNLSDATWLAMMEMMHIEVDYGHWHSNLFTNCRQTQKLEQGLLVIPDAAYSSGCLNGRSYKSLSPNKYAAVFDQLDGLQQVGVSIGSAHPEYCYVVAESIRKKGYQVEEIRGDLDCLIKSAFKYGHVLGGDTGPMKLLNEVLLDSQHKDAVKLGQVFNNSKPEQVGCVWYGIRGLGKNNGWILNYASPTDKNSDPHDLNSISTEAVVGFVNKRIMGN
jgi:hypothetical protein